MATKSITETGPKALKGVRNPDLYKDKATNNVFSQQDIDDIDKLYSRAAYNNYETAKGHIGYNALNDPALYNPQKTNLDYGSSVYDQGILMNPTQEDIMNQRADNQGVLTKAAAGIIKGGTLAGTTFIDGTLGLGLGIVEALTGGGFSKIWDNEITQTMDYVNNKAEEYLPNYYSTDEMENPLAFRNLFNANTIWDKLVKNFGFMVGAAYSGGIYAKGISAVAKGMGAIKGLASGAEALGASNKLSAVGSGLLRGVVGEKTALDLITKGADAMTNSNASRMIRGTVGSFFNAVAEGTVEAVSNSNDYVTSEIQRIQEQVYNDKMKALQEYRSTDDSEAYNNRIAEIDEAQKLAIQNIENTRASMGTSDFLFNLPILWIGDAITLGKAYAGGWRAARNNVVSRTKATTEALKNAEKSGDKEAVKKLQTLIEKADKTGYQGLTKEEQALITQAGDNFGGKYMDYAKAFLKGPIKEGNEEMAQKMAAESSKAYYQQDTDNIYKAMTDPYYTQETLDWVKAIQKGFANSYGDKNSWEEGLIGVITGILGSPTFGKSNNSTDQTWLGRNKMFGFTGGLYTEIRDANRERKLDAEARQHIDNILKDPQTFKRRMQHLVAQRNFSDKMEDAAIEDSEFDYKNAETAAAFEDIMYFKKTGRLDLLQKALENTELFDENDIQSIIDNTKKSFDAYNADINTDKATEQKITKEVEAAQRDYSEKYGEEATRRFEEEILPQYDSVTQAVKLEEFQRAKEAASREVRKMMDAQSSIRQRIMHSDQYIQSPYIKVAGDEATMMSNDEIKEDIKKRVSKTKEIIDDVINAQQEIDNKTGGVYTDEQLSTLSWYRVMMKNWARRAGDITKELGSFIEEVTGEYILGEQEATLEALFENIPELESTALNEKITYGGLLKNTKEAAHIRRYAKQLFEKLGIFNSSNSREEQQALGVSFARYLNSKEEIELKDKDGKVVKKVPLGEWLKNIVNNVIDTDITIDDNQKQEYKKKFEDLVKIGKAYNRYNELIDEYSKNPEKIDEVHARIDNSNSTITANKQANAIAQRFNWDEKPLNIARTLADNLADIRNFGGIEKFIKTLTPEQQEKLRKAIQIQDQIDSLATAIDDSNLDENVANFAKGLIENAAQDAESIEDVANNIREAINEGAVEQAADMLVDSNADIRFKEEALQDIETQLSAIFDDALEKAADALDRKERQRAADAKRDEEIEKNIEENIPEEQNKEEEPDVDKIPQEEEEKIPNPPEEANIPNAPEEQNLEVPEEGNLNIPEEGDLKVPEENEEDFSTRRSKRNWKPIDNKKLPKEPQQGRQGYGRRRQLSYYYLNGTNLMTLADAYKNNIIPIPKGVNREAFLKYIKEVTSYLKEKGAYDYIKNNLKQDDEIYFAYDEEASKRAGTSIVGIYTKDGQIIGTIKSQLDFDAYNESVKADPKKEDKSVIAQKLLYDKIVSERIQVPSKVSSMMTGGLAISNIESSVSKIMGTEKPVVAISINGKLTTGNAQLDTKLRLPLNIQDGQVYLMIPSSKGVYIPALVYSTPIESLTADDWYIQQAVDTFMEAVNSNKSLGEVKSAFAKWLPLNDLHINFTATNSEGKREEVITLNDAEYITIKFKDKHDKQQKFSLSLEADKSLNRNKVVKFVMDTAKYQDKTTNIDKNKLQDEEYMKHMASYIYTNIVASEEGRHTIDDWFTYEITDIENQVSQNKPKSPVNPAQQPTINKPSSSMKEVTVNGEKFQIDNGVVSKDGAVITDPTIVNQVKEASTITISSSKTLDLNSNNAFTAFGKGSPIQLQPAKPRRNRGNRNTDAKNMEVTEETSQETTSSQEQLEQAVNLCRKLFPELSDSHRIQIVNGLIDSIDSNGNPIKAFGLFKDGILYISNKAPIGTAFHEAFHYVTDTLLTEDEKARMFEEARKIWGNKDEIELEEKLSEQFRTFMNGQTDGESFANTRSIGRKLQILFRNLKHLLKSIFGKEHYLDTLFYNIYKGKIGQRGEQSYTNNNQLKKASFETDLLKYKVRKYSYDNLSQEERDYLEARKISKEYYESLNTEQKEILLQCM